MSSHSIAKSKKCWSCAFYTGKREIKHGIILGDSVDCDLRGTCTNDKSYYYNKTIFEGGSCQKHVLWGLLENEILAKEAQKQEKKKEKQQRMDDILAKHEREMQEQEELRKKEELERLEREHNHELKQQRREIEQERQKLAAERKQLEYDKWYMSLSDDEKKMEDARVATEKEEKLLLEQKQKEETKRQAEEKRKLAEKEAEARKLEEEQLRIRREEQRQLERKKQRTKIIVWASVNAIVLILFIISLVLFLAVQSAVNNSKTISTELMIEQQGKMIFFMIMAILGCLLLVEDVILGVYYIKKRF